MIKWLFLGLFLWLHVGWALAKVNSGTKYTNTWIVEIKGGEEVAQRVARDFGFTYKGKYSLLEDHYDFKKDDHPKLSLRDSEHLTRSILELDEVKWAKQQPTMKFEYKELIDKEEAGEKELVRFMQSEVRRINKNGLQKQCKNIFSCITFPFSFRNFFKSLRQGNLSKLGTFSTRPAPHSQLSTYKGATKNIELLSRKVSAYEVQFNDPLWRKQWYLQDYRTKDMPVMDHNVVPVYRDLKYTGKGVTVGVVDSPIQVDHPDLKRNIDLKNSYDLCSDGPLEKVLDKLTPDPHGTSSAGVIGMVENNKLCGVGIAYEAKIAAFNHKCDEEIPESDYLKFIIQNFQEIDIYSNSWGAPDDPSEVYVMDELMKKIYIKAAREGRQNKGNIYVHAAGNGGLSGDTCATDCYVNSPYIMGITSATQYGKITKHDERCTGIFATTYTGTKFFRTKTEGTVTLTTGSQCELNYMGTSASTPLAAGLIALLLQAKPELTYRDVMHIIARTSEVAPLANNENTWYMNGQGFWVSNDFGFGLMNAENMILLAKKWTNVPEKNMCIVNVKLDDPKALSSKKEVDVPFTTTACQGEENEVYYLEHLEVASVVEFSGYRGVIQMNITSPSRTNSILLESRRVDKSKDGLDGWSIMSTHNWGENPKGRWTITVAIEDVPYASGFSGLVKEFTVTFHGVPSRPAYLEQRRGYAAFRLPDGKTHYN